LPVEASQLPQAFVANQRILSMSLYLSYAIELAAGAQ